MITFLSALILAASPSFTLIIFDGIVFSCVIFRTSVVVTFGKGTSEESIGVC